MEEMKVEKKNDKFRRLEVKVDCCGRIKWYYCDEKGKKIIWKDCLGIGLIM